VCSAECDPWGDADEGVQSLHDRHWTPCGVQAMFESDMRENNEKIVRLFVESPEGRCALML
jgi:hypothetical protein